MVLHLLLFASMPKKAMIAGSELCHIQYAGSFEVESSALEQALPQLSERKHLPQGRVRPGFQYGAPSRQVLGKLSLRQ